ncbi:glycosyltransferase family 4 protein [Patescibacteria group bacterium]|nr:glycosyltransferase family 4 protein [Patescibacteria group bacterium]
MKNIIHIAIDGREANSKSRVGSNVYAFEILLGLYRLLEKRDDIKVTVLTASKINSDLPLATENWSYKTFGPKKFWTQWALPIHLFQYQTEYDVFFTPGHYAPRISAIPYVSSVMDTAYLEFPNQFKKSDTLKLTKWTKYSVKNAKKVIAISKYTKNEIIKNYHKPQEDIVIAYPAINTTKLRIKAKEVNDFFKKQKITEPYILFVGTLQPRKNLVKLIEAFEIFSRMKAGRELKRKNQLTKNRSKVKLVLAGKIGWLADDIFKKINSSPLKTKIITTGFVTESEKQILYKYASASCLVGTHEGFGIPPLESLNFGTPAIVSNTTSLPEVVESAGFLVDPNSAQDIANKIWEVYSMPTREKGLFRKKARQQVKKFNWNNSAKIILNVLIDVYQKISN